MTMREEFKPKWVVVLYDEDYVDTVKFANKSQAERYAKQWRGYDANNRAFVERFF